MSPFLFALLQLKLFFSETSGTQAKLGVTSCMTELLTTWQCISWTRPLGYGYTACFFWIMGSRGYTGQYLSHIRKGYHYQALSSLYLAVNKSLPLLASVCGVGGSQ